MSRRILKLKRNCTLRSTPEATCCGGKYPAVSDRASNLSPQKWIRSRSMFKATNVAVSGPTFTVGFKKWLPFACTTTTIDWFIPVGCQVLTTSSGEIQNPSPTSSATTCWVVKPIGLQDLSRVYFAFRDVYISEGSRVSVTQQLVHTPNFHQTGHSLHCQVADLHTNLRIADIEQSIQYDIYGNDVTGQETVLIEQICENSTCPMFGNMFSLSYYCEFLKHLTSIRFCLAMCIFRFQFRWRIFHEMHQTGSSRTNLARISSP